MSSKQLEETDFECVAIIGMAGRFPGATCVDSLWANVMAGAHSIRFFHDDELHPMVSRELRGNPNYIKARGVLTDIDKFDSRFFGYSPLEASVMDPQQRIFSEVAWGALEDAGCVPGIFPDLIGVFAGAGPNTYFFHHVSPRPEVMRRIGDFTALLLNEKDFLSTRVSYKFNLRGASFSVGTGCSTSLTAVFEACQHLLTHQCDAAIAGGVEITTPQNMGYLWHEGSIHSRDGLCRPFDKASSGMVQGNGAAAVVLKRLSDAVAAGDRIYAVIRGAGINNDGSTKIGFTSPSVEGQAAAIAMAQAQADVDPSTIGFIEAHGTGTQLGDPIEVEALGQAFGKLPTGSCALGSIKSNIGHLGIAAGVAGLIKATLALHHKVIPPTAHFLEANPQLRLESGPFYVNNSSVPFPVKGAPRRAGVSALGLGGTNVHIVLEEAPARTRFVGRSRPYYLFVTSARDNSTLARAQMRLAEHFERQEEQCNSADVALTLSRGRTTFPIRSAIVCKDGREAILALRESAEIMVRRSPPEAESWPIAFIFPGQGVQFAGMGRVLYEEERVFREVIDQCSTLSATYLGRDLRELLLVEGDKEVDANETLKQTRFTQPAIFSYSLALSRLWMSWGVKPNAMLGHSVGEYVAACLAGVFSLEDTLLLVSERGRLVQSMVPGSMLSVALSAAELEPRLPEGVSIAAYNSPKMVVVSGPTTQIELLRNELETTGVTARLLVTSHAFHSASMIEAAMAFRPIVAGVKRHRPSIQIVSTATGTWLTDKEAVDPDYWSQHVRKPVLFSQAVETLWTNEKRLLLEVGPRATTTSLAQRHVTNRAKQIAVASIGQPDLNEYQSLLQAVGKLWQAGVSIDFEKLDPRKERPLISIPTYPFERKEHWFEAVRCDFQGSVGLEEGPTSNVSCPGPGTASISLSSPVSNGEVPEEERFLISTWHDVLGANDITVEDDFFELGGHSLAGVQLLSKLKERYDIDFELKVLLQHSTIRKMAELIRNLRNSGEEKGVVSTSGAAEWSPLAMLNAGHSRPPLYCVAGIGGTVMELRHLAASLGANIPFYGLESRGVAGHEPHERIEEMAAENIRAIKSLQRLGPYYISGYSAGGAVAFEMAKQLRATGDEVALLAFIDSGSPTLKRRTTLGIRFVRLKRILHDPSTNLRQIWERRRHRSGSSPKTELEPFERVAEAMVRAYEHYQPTPYEGNVVLFRTYKDDYVGDITWVIDDCEGWRDLIKGEITVLPVPGRHLTVCQEPENAAVLGKAMREAYEVACARISRAQ